MRWSQIRSPRRRAAWLLAFTAPWTPPGDDRDSHCRAGGLADAKERLDLTKATSDDRVIKPAARRPVCPVPDHWRQGCGGERKAEAPNSHCAAWKTFQIFLVIVSIFTLGNSSDAFLVLRAQNLGVNVIGILIMLAVFNFVYAMVSLPPAGCLTVLAGAG